MDTVHYKIDGFNGSWVACEEMAVDGKQFFLMQNEQHGSNAAYVVLSDDGKVAVPQSKGFDDSTLDMIQRFLHPPIPPPVQDKPPLENW